MPTALSDPSQALYLILVVVAVITGAVWVRNKSRSNLINFGIALAVLAVLFVIDRLVESPREEASRRVQAMADAATAANPDQFVEHVSSSFDYRGKDRDAVRASAAWGLIRQHNARVAVWGLGRDDFQQVSDSEVEIGFFAKAQTPSNEGLGRYVKARFVRDPDGQYRVKTMKFFELIDTKKEEAIPYFP